MIRILFDGPPSFEPGRFVEVEGPDGASIKVGDWCDRGDGFWSLDIPVSVPSKDEAARIAELEAEIASLRARVEELEAGLPVLGPWVNGKRIGADGLARIHAWSDRWLVITPDGLTISGEVVDGTQAMAQASADACASKYWRLL
jgi:hypothetical protein